MKRDEIERLNREADRVFSLLQGAQRRQGESWDKPAGVQRRIEATIAKHSATLKRLEAQISDLHPSA